MRHHARMSVFLTMLCLLCALSATACGVSSSSAAGQSGAPALHVTLVGPPPAHTLLLDKDVRDATAVRRLYDAALALPPPKPGIYHCPAWDGSIYHLALSGIQGQVRTMEFNAGNCPVIHLVETDKRGWMDQAFLDLFKQTIGVSHLYPSVP